jgi:hypothetical protein
MSLSWFFGTVTIQVRPTHRPARGRALSLSPYREGTIVRMPAVRVKPLIKGALTFLPGMGNIGRGAGGQTSSAAYCYGVWLKHVTTLWQSGMRWIPKTLAELGPGNSLGTGLAAMLCGVDHYRALDVVEHSTTENNLRVFDELVQLFRRRAPRPVRGWPDYDRLLDDQLFPSCVLDEGRMAASLAPGRIERIRRALEGSRRTEGVSIRYVAPWTAADVISEASVDLVLSHAVLGEVRDPGSAYRAMHSWLKPGGFMSHQIGFGFAGFTGRWNGYWALPEPLWNVIKGRRAFTLNRLPSSAHLDLIAKSGFEPVFVLKKYNASGIQRPELSERWKDLSDEDLYCEGLFVQARKKALTSFLAAA